MSPSAQPIAFIDGKRLYLREVRLTDVNDAYYRWLNDPEVTRCLETRFVCQSVEKIRDYVETANRKADEIFLAICLKRDGRHIGNIKLGPVNWVHRFGEISLVIGDKGQWGKGYATEAIRMVCTYAFDVLGLHKVTAGSYATNPGSVRAFEKAGFEREGTWKEHYYSAGRYVDRICLGRLRPE